MLSSFNPLIHSFPSQAILQSRRTAYEIEINNYSLRQVAMKILQTLSVIEKI